VNCRPIANLCTTFKLFKKIGFKEDPWTQDPKKVDNMGQSQHGFKKGWSRATLCAEIPSIIARAMDGDKFVLVASMDLSEAFDLVNILLLFKRL
jgi:hypothetical protein